MDFSKNIILGANFINTIVLIVLIGILILEYFKRERNNREGILNFFILSVSIVAFVVSDAYQYIFDIESSAEFYFHKFVDIFHAFAITGFIIILFFFVIKFLIHTSGGKIANKK